jgi:LPXTG-motif cell wall-anchored protein
MRRSGRRLGAFAAAATIALGATLAALGTGGSPVLAQVVHGHGFAGATVLGWTSWYGSYDLGEIGPGWCVDHGLRAPDPALAYVPTDLAGASDGTRAAVAWAVGAHEASDPITAAALMLALHDLMGAVYPYGRLDVDALGPAQLAGFQGHEGEVVHHARRIKADALAHAHLRAPFALAVSVPALDAGGGTTATGRVTDAGGQPVTGVEVAFTASGATLVAGERGTTGGDGTVALPLTGSTGGIAVTGTAIVPGALSAWAPTAAPAQRIAHPNRTPVHGTASLAATTTTTTVPPTTTTVPPTTLPASPAPPRQITPTTVEAPETTTTTTAPPTTTSAPTPPSTTPAPPSPPQTTPAPAPPPAPPARVTSRLPRTGDDRTAGLVLVGTGTLLLGLVVRSWARSLHRA